MKYLTLFLCCFVLMACEEEDSGEITLSDDLVGTWAVTNLGQFANADCSGDLDYTAWGIITAFDITMEVVFNEDGTGSIGTTALGMTEAEDFTWDVDGDRVCLDGECASPSIDGDTMTITQTTDAYCEDDDGVEIDGVTMTECEAANNTWYPETCSELTITRQ